MRRNSDRVRARARMSCDAGRRCRVQETWEDAPARVLAHTRISSAATLDRVEIPRRRPRESQERILGEACPSCCGPSALEAAKTICFGASCEALRDARAGEVGKLMVVASAEVLERLLEDKSVHARIPRVCLAAGSVSVLSLITASSASAVFALGAISLGAAGVDDCG